MCVRLDLLVEYSNAEKDVRNDNCTVSMDPVGIVE